MAVRGLVSYWLLPLISGLVWLSMLLGLLLNWIYNDDSRRFPSMHRNQTIAYISDTGAFALKPLFIAGSIITVIFLDLAFLAERWLRHNGRLVPNSSLTEKVFACLSIFFAIVGTFGLIFLTIFDTYRHNKVHNVCLLLFIVGYILSAIFLCAEYYKLGISYHEHPVLRTSFFVKLVFIVVVVCLAIAFASTSYTGGRNAAAIIEWIVALIFTFYIFSFIIDLAPAVRTKRRDRRYEKHPVALLKCENQGLSNGDVDGITSYYVLKRYNI